NRATEGVGTSCIAREGRAAYRHGIWLPPVDHDRSAIAATADLTAFDLAGVRVDRVRPVTGRLIGRKLAVVDTEIAPQGTHGTSVRGAVGWEGAAADGGAE